MSRHKTLLRQLKKLGMTDGVPNDAAEWERFLSIIDRTYSQFEEDRYLLQRSLEISSEEMQNEIDANKKMKVHVNKLAALGTMASCLAHEINNPLSIVRGFSELLLNEKLSEKGLEKLKKVITNTDRISDMTKQILRIARKNSSDSIGHADLVQALDEAVLLFKNQFDTEGISVKVSNHTKDSLVIGDMNAFIGIFQNLLSNSKDAIVENECSDDARSIEIDIFESSLSKGLKVIYRDQAGGIPEHLVEQIFDPYFTTKDVGNGTGLGMAIAKQVIDDLGGKIELKNFFGKGVEFHIDLLRPQKEEVFDQTTSYFPSASIMDLPKVGQKTYKTLIVDDEASICEYLDEALSVHFNITHSSNPVEAINQLKNNHFDLLITDLKMPKVSGVKLAMEARSLRKDTKVVFITGQLDREESELSDLKPYLLINKPFKDSKILINQIKKFMAA